MSNDFTEQFKEEANELIEELEKSLLDLEKNPGEEELTRRIFRALHTLKGSGAMFGFEEISSFSHELENVFDSVRKGTLKVSNNLINIFLVASDLIRNMLDAGAKPGEEIKQQSKEIVNKIKDIVSGKVAEEKDDKQKIPEAEISKKVEDEKPEIEKTYRIRFKPSGDIYQLGSDIMGIMREINALGFSEVVPHIKGIPLLKEIMPERCYLLWDIILTTSAEVNTLKDIFILIEDYAEIKIDLIDEGKSLEEEEDYKKLGYILVERGDLTEEEMNQVLNSKKLFGEILVEKGIIPEEKIESALVEQKHIRNIRIKRKKEESISTLRVSSEKADRLVNLVGELVTLQARLGQLSQRLNDSELLTLVEEAERLIWGLRDNTMSIRMVPIGNSFGKFNRLVHDLCQDLGKEAELILEGGETELDKTVIEGLNDPLVHLIRNCIDHGIELPEEREKLGKQKQGKIFLTASYSGANVLITIKDDGGGINSESIRLKAIEKGLIREDSKLSDKEIFMFLFEAGFSTAKEITNISGRGVGLDVVKKNIDALRGTIQVDSEKNVGTAFTLKIPLTLAIIDGLMVMVEEEHFIIPLSIVEEIVELNAKELNKSKGRDYTNIRGGIVPFILLRQQFEIDGTPPDIQQIVVVEVEGRRFGFVVDHVIGKHQTVIKSLGKVYQDIDGLSGATILGDGSVALIIDVVMLAQVAESKENEMNFNFKKGNS